VYFLNIYGLVKEQFPGVVLCQKQSHLPWMVLKLPLSLGKRFGMSPRDRVLSFLIYATVMNQGTDQMATAECVWLR